MVTFETALSMTEFGRYQWMLLLVSGLVYFSYAYQNTISAYMGPAAQCDLQMTSKDRGILNAVFIIGGMPTAIFWGILADHFGRRIILIISLFVDAILTAASTFSQSFGVLLIFRFLGGAVMVAPGSIILTYLVESIGIKYRSRCVIFMGVFVTLSYVFIPLVAIAILPLDWTYHIEGFTYNSWRLFLLTAVVPSIVPAFIFLFGYPESPKFLYNQGRQKEALEVIENMYKSNFGDQKGSFPVKTFCYDLIESSKKCESLETNLNQDIPVNSLTKLHSETKSLTVLLKEMWTQAAEIVKIPHIWNSMLANVLMFSALYGYSGLGLWIPEVTDRFQVYYSSTNKSVTTCELAYIFAPNITNSSGVIECTKTTGDIDAYLNTFIMGVVCAIGNVIFSLIEEKFGTRFLTVFTLLVSSACAFAVYFVNSTLKNLAVACIFLTVAEAATMFIQSATSELFPTRIRGLAMCAAWLAGRAGAVTSNVTLGYLIDTICEIPVFLMAGTLLVGALCGMLLPGSKKKNKEENT